MICYKDKTFCTASVAKENTCTNKACFRFFSEEDRVGSRKWWNHDPDHAPVAFADFSVGCEDYEF